MFQGYGKIEETSAHWSLDHECKRKLKSSIWCATEKVHGANFCALISFKNLVELDLGRFPRCVAECSEASSEHFLHLQFAKRKEILAEDDEFFGYKQVADRIRLQLQLAFWHAFAHSDFSLPEPVMIAQSTLQIFGEIYGGFYPCNALPESKQGSLQRAVQTGIWYSPQVEFIVFDMAISDDSESAAVFMDWIQTMEVCKKVGLVHVPVIATGSMEEMTSLSPRFLSQVPKALGLPALTDIECGGHPNWAEGVVIRPMTSIQINDGKSIVRAMIKHKIPEFAEDSRFNQSVKNNCPKSEEDFKSTSEDLFHYLFFELQALINENRLNAVLSKIGRISRDQLKEVQRQRCKEALFALKQDALESFREVFADDIAKLNPSDETWLEWENELERQCKVLIICHMNKK